MCYKQCPFHYVSDWISQLSELSVPGDLATRHDKPSLATPHHLDSGTDNMASWLAGEEGENGTGAETRKGKGEETGAGKGTDTEIGD